ncbi:AAA family ATPase [Arthrobacter sp. HY1533]|uniref:AAA family ATPase n=1 Tax=Arthrobacter sp. HY1533 TaxID=2970919 RepID=UPI0022B9EC9A|nr:chromosome partitioning protein [Arthrobacter sp. HY1533]
MKPVSVVSVGDTPTNLIAGMEKHPGRLRIVRRCSELAGLLAACQSGLAQAAVIAAPHPDLTATLVDRLAAVGVCVVAVATTADEARRLRGIGVSTVTEQATAEVLAQAVVAAVEGRHHGAAGFSVPAADVADLAHDAGPRHPLAGGTLAGGGVRDGNPLGEREENPRTGTMGPGEVEAGVDGDAGSADTAPGTVPQAAPATALDAPPPASGGPRDPKARAGLWARISAATPRGAGGARKKAGRLQVLPPAPGQGSGPGAIVAVWGPIGSPGRTTLAVNLAAEQSAAGRKVLLIDADSYGASVAAALGLLDESASFAQACRAADQGILNLAHLARTATQVVFAGGTFHLLTGLTRADRWPELRAAAVERVLSTARDMAELVIVDCGFALENDEELSYDTVAPRRNAATLAVLSQAELIYAVGNGDPIGIPRLIRGLGELELAFPAAEVQVVVNKVRRRAVGGSPEKSLGQAWERFGPARGISHFLPWDPELTDKALLEGRLLLELSPDAPLRRAIRGLDCAIDQQKPKIAVSKTTA